MENKNLDPVVRDICRVTDRMSPEVALEFLEDLVSELGLMINGLKSDLKK